MAETNPRQKALNAATAAANKRLKESHLDEWNKYMAEEAEQRGQEWSPKKSPEQRAEEEVARLIEQYPHLAEKIKNDGIAAVI